MGRICGSLGGLFDFNDCFAGTLVLWLYAESGCGWAPEGAVIQLDAGVIEAARSLEVVAVVAEVANHVWSVVMVEFPEVVVSDH